MTAFISPYLTSNNSKYSMASTFWQGKQSTFLSIAPLLPHQYYSVTLWFFVEFSWVSGIWVRRQPRLCLQLNSDTYSEHSWISKMELSLEIVNGFHSLSIFSKSYILDVWLGDGYASKTLCFILLTETQSPTFSKSTWLK